MPGNPSKTVLIAASEASDEAGFRGAFAEAGLGHQLRFVFNGLEVVKYLEGKPPYTDRQEFPFPSVLLLDMSMPDGGGPDVLCWLKDNPIGARLPVVVLTGSDEDERSAMEWGAQDFYVKPESASDFLRIVQYVQDAWLWDSAE